MFAKVSTVALLVGSFVVMGALFSNSAADDFHSLKEAAVLGGGGYEMSGVTAAGPFTHSPPSTVHVTTSFTHSSASLSHLPPTNSHSPSSFKHMSASGISNSAEVVE